MGSDCCRALEKTVDYFRSSKADEVSVFFDFFPSDVKVSIKRRVHWFVSIDRDRSFFLFNTGLPSFRQGFNGNENCFFWFFFL